MEPDKLYMIAIVYNEFAYENMKHKAYSFPQITEKCQSF